MISTGSKVIYEAFGLQIQSDFLMPELPLHKNQEQAEIIIRNADLSGLWEEAAKPRQLLYVRENMVLFQVPGTATFCVQSGDTVLVSPLEGMDEDKVRLYLLGTCMAIILIQRKILPLHGSAIKIGKKAYAIVGESGAGKSTLASALIHKGFQLVSDDLIAVSFDEHQRPIVTPSFPQQKLWEESIQQLDMKVMNYRPLFERENKYAIPVNEHFYREPLPFGGVFELVKSNEEGIELQKLQGLKGIQTLHRQTFRNFLIPLLGLQEWHFESSVQFLKDIEVYQLRRPSNGFSALYLAETILSTIGGRNHIESYKQYTTS